MKTIKEILNFLAEFLTFLGYVVLAIMLFILLNTFVDLKNPCSNFSDTQDVCGKV